MTAPTRPAARSKRGAKTAAPTPDTTQPIAREVEKLQRHYRQMLLIRRFEERAQRAYNQALIGGYCHLNLGEEAAIVGLLAELQPDDYLFTNYREHGYAIARGIDPRKVMAELYGRVDGVSKGWGGSMHMFDVTHRLLGGYGIVGGQLPIATGAALAVQYKDGDQIVMCTMGDGTAAIGAFHESLNLAGLWNLPIVFVIINNGLGMGTDVAHSSAQPDLYKRGEAYRIDAARVDGLDPLAVAAATAHAAEVAAAGVPTCSKSSPSAFAGTRWWTLRSTAAGRRLSDSGRLTRCWLSLNGLLTGASTTPLRWSGSTEKSSTRSSRWRRSPRRVQCRRPARSSTTPMPPRSRTTPGGCPAKRCIRSCRSRGGPPHERDQLSRGTARHPARRDAA